MKKITIEQIEMIYHLGKKYEQDEISRQYVVDRLERAGMNTNTAKLYLSNIRALLRGVPYGRTVNRQAINYFLKKIKEDFGKDGLKKALASMQGHLASGIQEQQLQSHCTLYDYYKKILDDQL